MIKWLIERLRKNGTVTVTSSSIEVAQTREELPQEFEQALLDARKETDVSLKKLEFPNDEHSCLENVKPLEGYSAREPARFLFEYKDK